MTETIPKRRRLLLVCVLASLAASCDEGDADRPPAGSATAPLLEGRTIPVEYGGYYGVSERVNVPIDQEDPNFAALVDHISNHCGRLIPAQRYDVGQNGGGYEPAPGISSDGAVNDEIRSQAREICGGYTFLQMADGLAPIDIIVDWNNVTTVRPRRPGEGPYATLTIPVLTGSDAATAALVASSYFRAAAERGRYVMGDGQIDADAFLGTFPSAGEERVTAGFLITSQTIEATNMMREAADVAARMISAAARERHATDPAPTRAQIMSWRALHDSRLEIANLYLGVPEDLFEPEPSSVADGSALTCATCGFPVVTHAPIRASEDRAVELLRSTRVDPRSGGSATVGDRLRMALQEDHPDQFPTTGTTTDFLRAIGVEQADLDKAAAYLVEAAATTHVDIVADGAVEPIRVSGTEELRGTSDPTLVFAHTVGTLTYDDGDVDPDDPSYPPASFCERSIVAERECVRHSMDDFERTHPGSVTPPTSEITSIADASEHGDVRLVAHVCVGPDVASPDPPAASSVRLRLIGVPWSSSTMLSDLQSRFQIWWGDAGLRCALSRRGEACDEEHGIATIAGVYPYGDGYYTLEWSINGSALPDGAAVGSGLIPASGFIYLTERDSPDGARRGLTGFQTAIGVATGSFSRCTFFPIGPAVDEAMADSLVASVGAPEEPVSYCAGIEQRPLPLEDVFTEAGVSGDFMEAAFLHYLDRAETAAARAEQLGERLIQEQMEMNQMAEASIQRINQICGTTLSAGQIEITPPAACTSETDCPTGVPCEAGRCRVSPVDLIEGSEEDLRRLRRCLADDDEPVQASLGEQALCGWIFDDEVCACPESSDCPPCPAPSSASGECMDAFDEDVENGVEVPSGATIFVTRPLGLVSPDGPPIQASRSSCFALARLRSNSAPHSVRSELLRDSTSGSWFSLSAAQAVAQGLSLERQLGEFATLRRSGRPWISSGTLWQDPGGITPSACLSDHRIPPESLNPICEVAGPFGRSIRCGWGSCVTEADRAATNRRMHDALRALQLMSGVESQIEVLSTASGSLTDYTSEPLPAWLMRDGQIVTRQHPAAGGDPPWFAQCITQPPGTPPAEILPTEYWPSCEGYPFRRAPSSLYNGTTILGAEARSWAVGFWYPDNAVPARVPAAEWAEGTVTVRGMLSLAGDGMAPTTDFAVIAGRRDGRRWVQHTVTMPQAFDALELVCMSLEDDVGGCPPELEELPAIRSVEDLERLQSHVQCVADRFERIAERLVFLDMPPTIAEDIAASRITGTYPSYSGAYGAEVAELRRHMESVVSAVRQVASVVRDVGGDLRLAHSRERMADLEADLRDLELLSQMSSHLSRCLAASSPTVSAGTGGTSWNTGSVFVCADAVLQMVVAHQMDALREELEEEELIQARVQTAMQFSSRMDQIAVATRLLSESFAAINGSFSRMAGLRNEARRELHHALFLDRDDVGQEWVLGRAIRGRHNRTRAQYEEAHRAAVQLAYLARRAIEQRVGFDLSGMTAPLALVEPPNLWADTVCSTTGVNFYEVWSDAPDYLPTGIQTVADYVQRLRLFLDSYMLDYPFENSTDTVVLSLRDDFLRDVRMNCDVSGPNLLRASERADMGASAAGWWHPICDQGGGEYCSAVSRTAESAFVTRSTDPDPMTGIATRGTRALGGGAEYQMLVTCPVVSSTVDCGGTYPAGGGWGQTLELLPGEYLLSWYERVAPTSAPLTPPMGETSCESVTIAHGPLTEVEVLPGESGVASATVTALGYLPISDRWINDCEWRRVALHVTIPGAVADGPEPYEVAIHIGTLSDTTVSSSMTEETHAVGFAGVQLEAIRDDASVDPMSSDFALSAYFPTDDDGVWPVGPCTDRDGRDLRARFRYTCEAALCPDGIGTACISNPDYDPDLRTCYWETEVDISLLDIERGWTIPNGGFAVGNFNYRVDQLAVNLVGTNVRDCSRVPYGTAGCYASGYVPFSLHHTGGWEIRNHDGDPFTMSIFPGAIVSAKALATERYLTNPLSSADRSLLTDYWRGEFRGRPVNGHFVLRIHDVPGLDFSRVEDVQIALGYRYWTRQR